jgi:hypothetical protein
MKKITYSIIMGVALLLGGCEPIRYEVDNTGILTDVSQIEATVTKVTRNGYDNVAHVHCTSPVLCQWSDGINTFIGTEGDFTLLLQGENTITLTARAADGKTYTKTFPFSVSKAPELPDYYEKLFGDPLGEGKEWEWNTDWPAPDGGPVGQLIMAGTPSTGRDYWGWAPAPIVPEEGIGAKMKFKLLGAEVIKYGVNGAEIAKGKFLLDMTPNSIYASLGTFTFVGTNILSPVNPCSGEFGTTYTITYLDDDHLMFYISGDCSWYILFNAVP